MNKRVYAFLLALCLVLNMFSGVAIAETSHEHVANDESVWTTVEPNCTEAGYSWTLCTIDDCTEKVIKDEVKALGHKACTDALCKEYDKKAPTCDEEGTDITHCERCKVALKKDKAGEYTIACDGADHKDHTCGCYIPATGHAWGKEGTVIPAKAPTCDEDGHNEYIICTVCWDNGKGIEVIDPKHPKNTISNEGIEHNIVASENVDFKFPCELLVDAKGNPIREGKELALPSHCTGCDLVVDDAHKVVAFVEHKNVVPVEAKAADCLKKEDGYTAHEKCLDCGAEFGKTIIEWETVHKFDEKFGGTAGSCEVGGLLNGLRCSICKTVKEQPTPVTPEGHKLVQAEGAKAPTCTEDGQAAYYYCTKCNKAVFGILADDIKAQIDVQAKVSASALKVDSVEECDNELCLVEKDGKKVAVEKSVWHLCPTGHTWVGADGEKATCTDPGKTTYEYCITCLNAGRGEVINPENPPREIPAHGHSDQDGTYPEWMKYESAVAADVLEVFYSLAGEDRKSANDGCADYYTKPEDQKLIKKVTCLEDGYEIDKYCAFCGEVRVAAHTVPMLKHVERNEKGGIDRQAVIVEQAIYPTCETEGRSAKYYCEICKENYGEEKACFGGEVVKKLEHAHDEKSVVEFKLPGCYNPKANNDGNYEFWYCTNVYPAGWYLVDGEPTYIEKDRTCNYAQADEQTYADPAIAGYYDDKFVVEKGAELKGTYDETAKAPIIFAPFVIPAYQDHPYKVYLEHIDPTCTEAGVEDGGWYCLTCPASDFETISATNHAKLAEYKSGKAPTCTETGKKNYIRCEACEQVVEIALDADWSKLDMDKVREDLSKSEVNAKDYEDFWNEWVVIPANGHTEAVGEYLAPTCTKSGKQAGIYCKVCLASIEGCEAIPATGHSFTNPLTDEDGNVIFGGKPATCLENGQYAKMACANCDVDPIWVCGKDTCTHMVEYDCDMPLDQCNAKFEDVGPCEGCKTKFACEDCIKANEANGVIDQLKHIGEIWPGKEATCTSNAYGTAMHCVRDCCPVNTDILDAYYESKNNGTNTITESDLRDYGWLSVPGLLSGPAHKWTAYTGDVYCKDQNLDGEFDLEICELCEKAFRENGVEYIEKCTGDCTGDCTENVLIKHTWNKIAGSNSYDATCEKAGVEYMQQCVRCRERSAKTIAPKGHSYGEVIKAKDPTCGAVGYAVDHYICQAEGCGKYFVKTEAGEYVEKPASKIILAEVVTDGANGHTHADGTANKDVHLEAKLPTCKEAGYTDGWYCEICDKGEWTVTAPDAEKWHKWIVDNEEKAIEEGAASWVTAAPFDETVPGSGSLALKCACCGNYVRVKLWPEVKWGDVNMDGYVDTFDALMIMQWEVGIIKELPNSVVADYNGDHFVDTFDALDIMNDEINGILG